MQHGGRFADELYAFAASNWGEATVTQAMEQPMPAAALALLARLETAPLADGVELWNSRRLEGKGRGAAGHNTHWVSFVTARSSTSARASSIRRPRTSIAVPPRTSLER